MIKKNAGKSALILFLFMLAACLYFWLTSRYPGLSAKSVLGENASLSALGFSPIYEITDDFSFWEKVFAGTINWIHTNMKGMTFSFVVGAFFLSLLPLLKRKQFKNGFYNSVLGMFMGAPLGICVNCVAPVARSLHAAGTSLQTTLSTLIASPTLNVVVILMAFKMFPFYLVVLKIALTLVFILVFIPLACRYVFKKEMAEHADQEICEIESITTARISDEQQSWSGAIKWSIKSYLRNFLYLLKIALPLMILSGFLGSLLTTLMPWSSIEVLNTPLTMMSMGAVLLALAIFGTFLPSPMAFDIVLSAALLQAGVPIQYVAVFLFTLGSFSIYAFFIMWQAISLRVASFLFIATVFLGLCASFLSLWLEDGALNTAYNDLDTIHRPVIEKTIIPENIASAENNFDPILQRQDKAYSYSEIKPFIHALNEAVIPFVIKDQPQYLNLSSRAFELKNNIGSNDDKAFTHYHGEDVGIEQPYSISYISGLHHATALLTMSVATGDVHNDGWPDILISGDREVRPNLILYSNIDGRSFKRQIVPIAYPELDVTVVSLVDLNADGWNDIVFSAMGGQSFVIYNDHGNFLSDNIKPLTKNSGATTTSISFADVEKDGDLDIFMGNWSVGPVVVNLKQSKNILLRAHGHDGFVQEDLPGSTGETLTSMFSDFNDDGFLDLYVGNDFVLSPYSDVLLLGNVDGAYDVARAGTIDGLVGTESTMSIDVGDIDNDLRDDYYIGQIAYLGQYTQQMSKIAAQQIAYSAYCKKEGRRDLARCEREMKLKLSIARGSHYITDACSDLDNEIDKAKCLNHMIGYSKFCAVGKIDDKADPAKNKASKRYNDLCNPMDLQFNMSQRNASPSTHLMAANNSMSNVLLHNQSPNKETRLFTDEAKKRKVGYGAWTWNARFADLDNDGWQDIYIVNGYPLPMALSTNLFYHNTGNGDFSDQTIAFGLENYTPTSAFSFVDLDNDGDLDIVGIPSDAPVQIYINNARQNAIQFELSDYGSNNRGSIGAKVIIGYHDDQGRAKAQSGYIKGSGGYKSYNQHLVHFGLSNTDTIESVEVHWPDGKTDHLKGDFKANRRYKIQRSSMVDMP